MKKLLLFVLFVSLSITNINAQQYWGGSGSWSSSLWGSVDGGPYNAAWVANGGAVFNVPNSTITGATLSFSSIVANENVTVSPSGTIGTGGTIATINVASG